MTDSTAVIQRSPILDTAEPTQLSSVGRKDTLATRSSAECVQVTPFLKWAGGKRWFVPRLNELVTEIRGKYIEPFLGSGVAFFSLLPSRALLGDSNEDLIATYMAIRDDWRSVVCHLSVHHQRHSRDYYYSVRKQAPSSLAERAARFIYLNRTCWNGLYRVNRSGQFNVPIGTRTEVIRDTDDFESVSSALRRAKLLVEDFEVLVDDAVSGDLIFADPPYTVQHDANGFIKYNEKLFSWEDQCRLSKALTRAVQRGASVICTNACHDSIRELYSNEFTQEVISRSSCISGSAAHRGRRRELLILSNDLAVR